MKTILSIQSHVAYGYVGNRAAAFPLQAMGHEVIAVNTVQFSNHTGYGRWAGQVFGPDHIADVLGGLRDLGALNHVGAVLSGYLGDARLGGAVMEAVQTIRARNPDLVYCCDPVMGDVGRGLFVAAGIPEFFRDEALPMAGILTPNLFELSLLTGCEIAGNIDALRACRTLHERGAGTVLVTSLETADTPAGTIQMMASTASGECWILTTPRLPLDPAPNGAGDMTAALFTGHVLNGASVKQALERTAGSVFTVFEKTKALGRRELALIQAQDSFRAPPARFYAAAFI